MRRCNLSQGVLRQIVERSEVSTKYHLQTYAVKEYFGYLRRQPDAFYLDWITLLNQTNDPRGHGHGLCDLVLSIAADLDHSWDGVPWNGCLRLPRANDYNVGL